MIPESRRGGGVRLYKADVFPTKWTFVKELLHGSYADPSLFFKDNLWWLFVLKGNDTLTLHYADHFLGPWQEHPNSPIIKGNLDITRPGGRVISYNDRIIRYVQDCDPIYGNALRVFEVDTLTIENYKDHEITASPILEGTGSGWNSIGMHHADPHQLEDGSWIACVDGKGMETVFNFKAGVKRLLQQLHLY